MVSATPPDDGPALATLLRTWRERALLTQEQLADLTGLGVRTVRRLESDGLRRPRGDSLRLLADALNLGDDERALLVAVARGVPGPDPGDTGGPRQLPADVAGFCGRGEHLRRLDALLDRAGAPAVVIIAVTGTAGVGKTTLAVHWAHRVSDRFPDGHLYANLHGFDPSGTPADPAVVVRGFLDALGVAAHRIPAELDAQAALFRSRLAGRRMLIVLDNARDAQQVRPLLPGSPTCVVLVTSRDELTGLLAEGARPLGLDLMSIVEARALLADRIGEDRAAGEPDAGDEIINRCARLPLAIALVAARAAAHTTFPLATLAAELADARQRLDALDTLDRHNRIRAVFSWSYRQLSPPAAVLFGLLGRYSGPDIGLPAAASLADRPAPDTRRALAELTQTHLVTEHTPGRYGLHDLLRMYATELAHTTGTEDDRTAALRRLLDHYLHTAYVADHLIDPRRHPIQLARPAPGVHLAAVGDVGQAWVWFAGEYRGLVGLIASALREGFAEHAWQLAWAVTTYQQRRGHWQDWVAAQSTALDAARQLDDRGAAANAHRGIARAFNGLGRFDDAVAHCHQALDLFAGFGDRTNEAHTHLIMAIALRRQGRIRDALGHLERALELYRAVGRRTGQARVLNNIGLYRAELGEPEVAIGHCHESLDLNREIGDRYGEGAVLETLGYAYHRMGQPREAVDHLQRALAVFREAGDRYHEATTLRHLGEAQDSAGDPETARATWREALLILDELDHPDAGEVRVRLARPDQAAPGVS